MDGAYDAVISETYANKLFGGESPIGKSVRISDSTSVTITGIMEDVKRSVIPNVDLLLRIERVGEFNGGLTKTTANNAGSCIAFLLVKPGADLKARTDEILAFFKERFGCIRRLRRGVEDRFHTGNVFRQLDVLQPEPRR